MKKNCIKTLKTLVSKGICTHGGGGCMTKQSILSICSLAVLLSLSTPAQADEIYTPTLDKLHQSGTTMPDTSEIYPESAYTLTESAQNAENTITLYEKTEIIRYYDPLTGQEVAKSDLQPDIEYKEVKTIQTTPKYYQVALKQTEYGSGDGEKYFKWENTENGLILTETDKANAQITAKYDTTQSHTHFKNTSDKSSMNITGGSFVNQTVGNTSGEKVGGAIYNSGSSAKLGDISADFIGNSAISTGGYSAYGGAIYNYYNSTIGDITGDFIGNYASVSVSASARYYASGGAIYNYYNSTIGDITGDFIGNYASGSASEGGAIYNYYNSTIGDITGNFIGNYAISDRSSASGGAIYNDSGSTIGDITGDFIGNYAASDRSSAKGSAIFNDSGSSIGSITGNFIGNYAVSGGGETYGGAIYNYNNSTIGNITGDFIGNYTVSDRNCAYGGAIFNGENSTMADITGNFIGNYISVAGLAHGGAIFNDHNSTIGDITGDFIGNYAVSGSGETYGGAIYNENSAKIGVITGDFIGNYAYGGAIYNSGTIGNITGSFINNYAQTTSDSALALGGAIYTTKNLTITANNQPIEFTNNYTQDPTQGKIPNAIFVNTSYSTPDSPVTITLSATNNGSITLNDQIDGGKPSGTTINRSNQYNLSLTGDKTGKITLKNDVINANITLDNTNLHLGRENVFDQSQSLTLNSGSISLNNNTVGTMHIPTLNLNNNTNLSVDVDLANESMDRITADNYSINENAKLNVNNITLLSTTEKNNVKIIFADQQLAQNVTYSGPSPIAYSPLYKYHVSYSQNPEDNLGYFIFDRSTTGTTSNNPSDNFNPAALTSPVTTQAGAYSTQLQTFNYAFQHSDNFMNLPYLERLTLKSQNKYALSPTGDATDVGTLSPLFTKEENAGLWLKPYASFESIPLNNGPKVSNINYGTLIGHDSELTPIKHGFDRVLTSYIGYNGASQRFNGVDAYQNGALIGSTITLYKNNFFNATTTSIGASTGSSTNMYGSEHYSMLLAGIANKAGYNLEFKNGKIILQPSFLISYTFVNTFDYNNSAGLRIKSDPLHAIQLAPGLKLIANTNSGWQPYLAISMIWNILDKTNVKANDTRLPEMSIDPYLQYGLGLQKPLKNNYLAYAQAMIHSGGRNGISLSAGLRWKIGKNK